MSAPSLHFHYRNFITVGSEEARRNASLRPPLKLDMQFYSIQLSRRCSFPGCYRRYQSNQVHQPEFTIKYGRWQRFPACTTPSLKFMRPNTPHNPAVKSVKELSDVGTLEIIAPTSYQWINPLNQCFRIKRNSPFRSVAYLIHEPLD